MTNPTFLAQRRKFNILIYFKVQAPPHPTYRPVDHICCKNGFFEIKYLENVFFLYNFLPFSILKSAEQ
jgi:hypothetical protein